MKAIRLESARLIFEPLSTKHLSMTYVNWLNDNKVNQYLETGGNYTLKELETFLFEQEQKDILFWAIHIKETYQHIGNIKIDPINIENNSGEYGIMMGETNQWGKGYAKEASIAIIEYCFKNLNLSKITLGVVEVNVSAIKLYEKLGFVNESIIENYGVYENRMCSSLRMVKNND